MHVLSKKICLSIVSSDMPRNSVRQNFAGFCGSNSTIVSKICDIKNRENASVLLKETRIFSVIH